MNNQSNEKFMLQEFLTLEKQTTSTYNTWAGECENNALRTKFLDILDDVHCIQNDIFKIMNQRGYYPVKPATQQELTEVKQKFC